MNRRRFLELTGATAAYSLVGTTASAAAGSTSAQTPPGVAWRHTYDDLRVDAVAPAHGGGHVLVGRARRADPDAPVGLALVDGTGSVRRRTDISPDIPEEARRAGADVIRTERGYAVATGPWFAEFDTGLSVETTGSAPEYEANSTTLLVELSDGFAVAIERDTPNHVSTQVVGFAPDGEFRWERTYGRERSSWLELLIESDDGLIVGGRAPWLAGLAADGTERWETTVTDAPSGVGASATRDDQGITLFGLGTLVRLTASRSVDWQRTYASSGNTFGGELVRAAHGGYVVAARVGADRILVGRTDADGRLRWSHEYTVVDEGFAILNGLVERSPGEYLVVGSRRKVPRGWALLLSEAVTPTPTRTPTPTLAGTASPSATDSPTPPTVTDTPTPDSTTTTTLPGFGFGAALVGVAGGLLARRRYLD